MRCASVIYAATVACLAVVFASASVRADVFDFSFGPRATGTFTTGAAASDPGYELITSLTFDVFKGVTIGLVRFSFTNLAEAISNRGRLSTRQPMRS